MYHFKFAFFNFYSYICIIEIFAKFQTICLQFQIFAGFSQSAKSRGLKHLPDTSRPGLIRKFANQH